MSRKNVYLSGVLLLAAYVLIATPSISQAAYFQEIPVENHSFENDTDGWEGTFTTLVLLTAEPTDPGVRVALLYKETEKLKQTTDYVIKRGDIFYLGVYVKSTYNSHDLIIGDTLDIYERDIIDLGDIPSEHAPRIYLSLTYGDNEYLWHEGFDVQTDVTFGGWRYCEVECAANDFPECFGQKIGIEFSATNFRVEEEGWVNVMYLDYVELEVISKGIENSDVRGGCTAIVACLNKGIENAIGGDINAQVHVSAETDGPDYWDDVAVDANNMKDTGQEPRYLHAKAIARAQQIRSHFAEANLSYGYGVGWGWFPSSWKGRAIAWPDSSPEPDSDNRTEAAAVGAFALNGVLWIKGYIEEDYAISEVPRSPKVGSTNAVLLEFSESDFKVVSSGETDKVVVRPADDLLKEINLFHNYAGYASASYFPSIVSGLNSMNDEMVDEMKSNIAAEAGLIPAGPGQRAELTISSAAVQFDDIILDLKKSSNEAPVNKTKGELLVEYFDNGGVTITATDDSQADYTPDVQARTTLSFGSTLPLDQLDEELRERMPSIFGNDIGLFFVIDGSLEKALNSSAKTEGTALNQLVSSLSPGDSFNIDLNFGTGESISCYDSEKSAVTNYDVMDIGGPQPLGNVEVQEGVQNIIVTAGGAGIGSTEDQFSFVFRNDELGQPVQISGDFVVVVDMDRMETAGEPDTRAKAGLMIRESMQSDSPFLYALVTPASDKVIAEGRNETGGQSWQMDIGSIYKSDDIVRLGMALLGNTITFSCAVGDGQWTPPVSQECEWAASGDVYIGLATASGQQGTSITTEFSKVNFVPIMGEPVLLPALYPRPENGAADQSALTGLSWEPGLGAVMHTVYFGTDSEAIANAVGGIPQEQTTFNPGELELATTYYWRVDSICDDENVTQGDVWSFTTALESGLREEYSIIGGPSLIPVLEQIVGQINVNAGSGSPHASVPSDNFSAEWTCELTVPVNGTYTLILKNDNAAILYVDGIPVIDNYKYNGTSTGSVEIDLVAGQMYSIRLVWYHWVGNAICQLFWSGPGIPLQIIPAGAFVLPLRALDPDPSDGAQDVPQETVFRWRDAMEAIYYDLYIGIDQDAVSDADSSSTVQQGQQAQRVFSSSGSDKVRQTVTANAASDVYKGRQTETTYSPGPLEWGKTYYWRVDAVEADGTIRKGHVWSFTTANFLHVDDFESYTDNVPGGETVFQTWFDGEANGTGSVVGYYYSANGTFGDTTVFYDGRQSMPLFYNNNQPGSLKYSETLRAFTPALDLTVNGMDTLTLYVQGKTYNGVVPLYVGLQSGANRKNVTYGDQMIVRSTSWVEVNIPLADFTGVNTGAVNAMYIGLGNPDAPTTGGAGQIFIDAIRATKAAEVP